MNIYISGISGTAMGALALFLDAAGYTVFGSDQAEGAVTPELKAAGIEFEIGNQNGDFLNQKHNEQKIDWFVYTSALPKTHPELLKAQELGLKISKRDELIAFLTQDLNLKMVAIAGTHGKTTTTAILIWACKKLNLPVAWLEGTTLGFAPAGKYEPGAKYLIYEADEYDHNFLAYHPWLSLITVVDYDHPDIYPTRQDYIAAFDQFKSQSLNVIESPDSLPSLTLAGSVRRKDATLALFGLQRILSDLNLSLPEQKLIETINAFPGAGRRFEQIANGVYSDYAHHPAEIKATIEIAKEEAKREHKQGVIVIYEPHQNSRQHEIKNDYAQSFQGADHIFWLPTFLTRENPALKTLTPTDFINILDNSSVAEPAELNDDLAKKLKTYKQENYLILLMTAGPADGWLRRLFVNI